jgi:hypothetical protein
MSTTGSLNLPRNEEWGHYHPETEEVEPEVGKGSVPGHFILLVLLALSWASIPPVALNSNCWPIP